jgi:hypothetical protein
VPAFAFHGGSKGSGMPAGRLAFDLSFFVLVTIVGMNVVFGIIVDTFSELRSDKNETQEKMTSECFICGLKSSDFDRFGQGWKHHIKKEHHMWNYMYPFGRALSLQHMKGFEGGVAVADVAGAAAGVAGEKEKGGEGVVTNAELFTMLKTQQEMIAMLVQKLGSKDGEFNGFNGSDASLSL